MMEHHGITAQDRSKSPQRSLVKYCTPGRVEIPWAVSANSSEGVHLRG